MDAPESRKQCSRWVADQVSCAEAHRAASRDEGGPLVEALRALGFPLRESVWELLGQPEPYPEAVPLLTEHLRRTYSDPLLEGIAHALAVPEARPAWHALRDLFARTSQAEHPDLKWALGCALSLACDAQVRPELLLLLRDRSQGTSRLALLAGLRGCHDAATGSALFELEDDPDLAPEVHALLERRRRWRRGTPGAATRTERASHGR